MKFFNELFIPIVLKEKGKDKIIGYRVVDEFINNDIIVVVKELNDDNIPEFNLVADYDYIPIILQYYNNRVYFIDITNCKIYLIKNFS